MAYSPLKRKSESVIGYVHELSPIKKNKSRTLEYYSLTLQKSSTQHREALLYRTQKSKFLEESLETRTPVILQNITYTADGKKIVINDMTFVRPLQSQANTTSNTQTCHSTRTQHQSRLSTYLTNIIDGTLLPSKERLDK